MSPTDFTKLVQTRLGVVPDAEPGSITLAALDRQLPEKFQVSKPDSFSNSTLAGPEAKLATAIIANAKRFCGLKEVRPNQSWDNPDTTGPDSVLTSELIAGMRQSPWEDGWAYCAAFAEAVVAMGLKDIGATPEQIARFRKVMSPHCMTSVRAFKQLSLLSLNPVTGAVWLAKHGSTDNGHAGIVVRPHTPNMDTVEANTSYGAVGNQREGDWITEKVRPISGPGELRTQGFVHPSSVLKICGII